MDRDYPEWVGTRHVVDLGDSVGVALPKKAIREKGIDPEELIGESSRAVLDGLTFSYDIPEVGDRKEEIPSSSEDRKSVV